MIILSPEALLVALRAIHRGTLIVPSHPLVSFALVQQYIQLHGLAGEYALSCAIHSVIERTLLKAVENPSGIILTTPRYQLTWNFAIANPQIQTYTLLYFRYLRPDLGVSSEQLAQMLCFSPRTIRRKQAQGINLLALDLLHQELSLRERNDALTQSGLSTHEHLSEYAWAG